jgi:prepilin-type N-terminal cleavage/methylation domain-containing protein
MKKGFSQVELLLVIALLAIFLMLGTVVFRNFFRQDQLLVETRKIESLMAESRAKTIAGFTLGTTDAKNFGLYFLSDRYFLFPGTVFDSGNDQNQEILLPANLEIIEVGFSSQSLVFAKITGEVEGYQPGQDYLVLVDSGSGKGKKISVNQLGTVTVEDY